MSPRAAWRLESLGFGEVYDYVGGKLDWLAAGLDTEGNHAGQPRAAESARRDALTCGLEEPVGDVHDRVESSDWDRCWAVNDEGVLLGVLGAEELKGDRSMSVEEAMRPGPSTFRPHVPVSELEDYMREHDLDMVPITSSDGRLIGILTGSG